MQAYRRSPAGGRSKAIDHILVTPGRWPLAACARCQPRYEDHLALSIKLDVPEHALQ